MVKKTFVKQYQTITYPAEWAIRMNNSILFYHNLNKNFNNPAHFQVILQTISNKMP